jgi:signal transduction histidine kinase
MAATMELGKQYASALEEYVKNRTEASAAAASDLGREALGLKMGILDMVIVHHECLARVLASCETESERSEALYAASSFFCEALAAFEMAHRGFLELSQTVSQIIQFAAVVCHELRTPLTSVMTSTGLLAELLHPEQRSTQAQLLANIEHSAAIMKERTDDLLDLVGFQSGNLSIRAHPVVVADLVLTTCRALSPLVENAGMTLRTELAADIPDIDADPKRLEQILTNLIHNAVKYGSDGPTVDVRVFPVGDRVVIEVQDHGSGVSLWEQMRIFEPYFRGSRPAHEVPGLGIGLALCKELVQQHHGTIALISEPGNGSTFRVSLPITTEIHAGVEHHESSDSRRRSGSRRKH